MNSIALPLAIIVLFLATISYMEWKTFRIPNQLTFGTIIAGFLFAVLKLLIIENPTGGLGACIVGMIAGSAILFPFYMKLGLGAGCVKVQAAVGVWMGCAYGAGDCFRMMIVSTLSAVIIFAPFVYWQLTEAQNALAVAGSSGKYYGHQVKGQLPLTMGTILGIAIALAI